MNKIELLLNLLGFDIIFIGVKQNCYYIDINDNIICMINNSNFRIFKNYIILDELASHNLINLFTLPHYETNNYNEFITILQNELNINIPEHILTQAELEFI